MTLGSAIRTHETGPFREKSRIAPVAPALKDAETRLRALCAEIRQGQEALEAEANRQVLSRDLVAEQRWFVVTDALALLLGFVCSWALAIVINQYLFVRPLQGSLVEGDPLHFLQFLMIAAAMVLWFEHTDHYRVRMPFWLEIKKVMGALGIAMMVDGFLQFASKQDISRLWLVSGWIIAGVALIALRGLLRTVRTRQGRWQVPTLLVGNGVTADDARAAVTSEPGLGYAIVAQIADLPGAFRQAGESWARLCAAHGAQYVIIALDGPALAKAELSLAQLMRENVPFSVAPPLRNIPVFGMMPQYFFNHDVMLMTRSNGLDQPMPRVIKRSFDVCVAGLALVVLCPFMVLLALLVRLDGGPAFFRQQRPGLHGRLFTCFKFRSMVPHADEALKRHLAENAEASAEYEKYRKLRHDPRVTRLGTFLRRYSLDELPQLINVLRGDMSLVGPRPILVSEKSLYSHDIAHYYKVRPGITGLWQVSGRNKVSFAKRVQMESWYVRNWSLWHDIAILCKTVPVLFKKTGAY